MLIQKPAIETGWAHRLPPLHDFICYASTLGYFLLSLNGVPAFPTQPSRQVSGLGCCNKNCICLIHARLFTFYFIQS